MSNINNQDRKEWDKAAVTLPYRAEQLNNATESFAHTIFMDTLKARHNQIIYGRRGTGKTHLLKRLAEEYSSNFKDDKTVPIYINGLDLKQQAQVIIERAPAVALCYYVEFIKLLTEKLYNFIHSTLDIDFWESFLGGPQKQTARKAQAIAKDLYEFVQNGEAYFLPLGEASHEVKTLNETLEKVEGGIHLSLSDPKSIGWKVDVGAKGGIENRESGVLLKRIQGTVILPFSQVSVKIKELLNLLKNAYLVVLFDEWSSIDNKLDIQPYLADMIKRTFSSTTQIYLKIACIPNRTLLATPITSQNPIPIGYEEGDDITADVDLDSVVFLENDLTQFLPFFMTVLKKHMGRKLDWVKEMELSEFDKFITTEVFDKPETFSELCQASAGIPRDFLNLFRDSTLRKVNRQDANQQDASIKLVDIRDTAAKLFETKRKSFPREAKELTLLNKIYRQIIAKNKTYFFLLPEDPLRSEIEMLWTERLIHKIPAKYYDRETDITYIYYQIDYGKCVNLLKELAREQGRAKGEKALGVGITGAIVDFMPGRWTKLLTKTMPTIMGLIQTRKALAEEPAGNIAPNPQDIMVDDAIFQ